MISEKCIIIPKNICLYVKYARILDQLSRIFRTTWAEKSLNGPADRATNKKKSYLLYIIRNNRLIYRHNKQFVRQRKYRRKTMQL